MAMDFMAAVEWLTVSRSAPNFADCSVRIAMELWATSSCGWRISIGLGFMATGTDRSELTCLTFSTWAICNPSLALDASFV